MSKENCDFDKVGLPDPKEVVGQIIDELMIEVNAEELDGLSNQMEELTALLGSIVEADPLNQKIVAHLRRMSERLDLVADDLRNLADCPVGAALHCHDPAFHAGIEKGGQQFKDE